MRKGQYTNKFTGAQFFKKILGILFAVAHDFEITSVELDVMAEHLALPEDTRFTHKGCEIVFEKTKRSVNNQKNMLATLSSKRVLVKASSRPLRYEPVSKFRIDPSDINLNITLIYGER